MKSERQRCHCLLLFHKCHPEIAGVGVEYSWGKSKMEFRTHFNNGRAADLQDRERRPSNHPILSNVFGNTADAQ